MVIPITKVPKTSPGHDAELQAPCDTARCLYCPDIFGVLYSGNTQNVANPGYINNI